MVKADGVKEVDITVDPPRILFEWTGIDHLELKDSLIKVNNRTTAKMKELCESDWDIQYVTFRILMTKIAISIRLTSLPMAIT